MHRLTALLSGFLAISALTASLALSQDKDRMTEVSYLGHMSYPSFTRLVFDTGGAAPEDFKVNYDDDGKRVVFYPLTGTLAFTFAREERVDSLVREVDFVQSYEGKRGIAASLAQDAAGCSVSRLSDPSRLVLDIYRNKGAELFLNQGNAVKTIALDPGHGGRTTGAGSPGDLVEKDLTLDIAVRLRNILARQGYKVVLTRDRDADVALDERAGIANNARADLYLSIHAAGSFRPEAPGISVYTLDAGDLDGESAQGSWDDQGAPYLSKSLDLAADLAASLGSLSNVKPAVQQARLAGIEGLAMPAAMVEIGNLSDPRQADALADDPYRDKLAGFLAEGINRYAKEVNR